MSFEELLERTRGAGIGLEGKRIGFDFGDLGGFVVDGAGAVTKGLSPCDCTFRMSLEEGEKLFAGELDIDEAFVDGRLKVQGDLAVAVAFAGRLSARRAP